MSDILRRVKIGSNEKLSIYDMIKERRSGIRSVEASYYEHPVSPAPTDTRPAPPDNAPYEYASAYRDNIDNAIKTTPTPDMSNPYEYNSLYRDEINRPPKATQEQLNYALGIDPKKSGFPADIDAPHTTRDAIVSKTESLISSLSLTDEQTKTLRDMASRYTTEPGVLKANEQFGTIFEQALFNHELNKGLSVEEAKATAHNIYAYLWNQDLTREEQNLAVFAQNTANAFFLRAPEILEKSSKEAIQQGQAMAPVAAEAGTITGNLMQMPFLGAGLGQAAIGMGMKAGLARYIVAGATGGVMTAMNGIADEMPVGEILRDTAVSSAAWMLGAGASGWVSKIAGRIMPPVILNKYLNALSLGLKETVSATAFTAGQIVPQELANLLFKGKSEYVNNPTLLLNDIAQNVIFSLLSSHQEWTQNRQIAEAVKKFSDAKAGGNRETILASLENLSRISEGVAPELSMYAKAAREQMLAPAPDIKTEVKTEIEKARKGKKNEKAAEAPQEGNQPGRVQDEPAQVQKDEAQVRPVSGEEAISTPIEGVKALEAERNPSVSMKVDYETPEAKNLVKTPEDRKAVEDFLAEHQNATQERLHETTLELLSQVTPENAGGLLKVNLQLFAMKQLLSEKMGVDNVSKVLERVFGGSDLSRLTPEAIEALELRNDNHIKYTPLVVTYEKIVNQEVWDAATKRIETEAGRREVMQKYESNEIPTAEDVSATLQIAEQLLSSDNRADIILGSELLARLSNKASRMGQAIEILAKAYAEMGIMNGVKNEILDSVSGMKKREYKKGTSELKDKAKKDIEDISTDIDKYNDDMARAWKEYETEQGRKLPTEERAAWIENYRKEHANDRYENAPDTRVTPSERLANTLDELALSKYRQGPEESKPLVNLVSELMRMVKENHPELGTKLKDTKSALENIMFLVKNRKEYGKILDEAFEMIESAYRADPKKYPVEFIEEMHKYLNDTAELRNQRYDAAVLQVLDETGMSLKELIVDWMKGDKKLQTFLDYIREKSNLSPEDTKFLVDEMQKRLDVLKEQKRSSILKNMFRDVKRGERKTLEDKYMEALGLGVITDTVYGEIWAKKMGIPFFSPEMAVDIQKTMREYFAIDENAMYPTGKRGTKGLAKALHKTFGSQYDGASEAPGWYIRQQMYDSLIERMATHIPMETWGRVESFLYSSMLSGFNSWVKNPAANVILAAAARLSDIPNAAIQTVFMKPGKRTVSAKSLVWMGDAKLKKIVSDVYERRALPSIKSEGLEAGIARVIQRNRRTFGRTKAGDVLEALNKLPFKAMEYGDVPFLRSHFEDALGKYMAARGIYEVADAAYRHAYEIALENTFRDMSAYSFLVNSMKKLDKSMPDIRKLQKEIEGAKTDAEAIQLQGKLNKLLFEAGVIKVAKQAVIPFVNTTINVGLRMIDYSPYGAFKVLGEMAFDKFALKQKLDGAKVAREFSKVITGTFAGAGLGFLFSLAANASGIVSINGGYPTNNAEKKRWEVEGRKPYTLGFKMADGRWEYVSFDWATPAVAPFFMGAMFEQTGREDGWNLKAIEEAGIAGMDVLWQMSFVQSLNNLLGGYGTPTQKGANVLLSFPGQFIPNWMSRLNYIIDDTVRVYPSDSKDVVRAAINNLIRKLPGGTLALQPKLDCWGNELKQGQINPSLGAFGRFLNAYLAPYRVYNGTVGPQTDEVVRIYRAARDAGDSEASSVLPDFSAMTLPAEDIKEAPLTADEVTELNRIAGNLAQERLAAEMKSPEWATLPDYAADGGSKYAAIRRIYEDARADAQAAVEEKRGITPKNKGTPSYLSVSMNGKTTNYTISEAKYQQYVTLAKKYKAEGYTNYNAAATSEILRGLGYNVPLVIPKKAYRTTNTPDIVDTRGG